MSSRASIAVHALHLVHEEPALVIAEIGPVCVCIWRGAVTPERFERERAALHDVARRYSPNAGFLCIVEEDAAPPNAELRKAVVQMMVAVEKDLCCAAMVIEGRGFKAALVRSVLLGMVVLLGRRRYPLSYLATVAEATTWMSKYLTIPPPSFNRDIAELRARRY